MLVYSSRIPLVKTEPLSALLEPLRDWLSNKMAATFTSQRLEIDGDASNTQRHRAEWLRVDDGKSQWFALRYSHPDRTVRGRDWITDVGAHRSLAEFFCTIVLRTDEHSALVPTDVRTTRPKLVADIFQRCRVAAEAAGGRPRALTLGDAEGFLAEVHSPDRTTPIVQLCHDEGGDCPIDPDRAASLLAGVASVVVIPAAEDTRSLEHALSSRFSCYHGATNVIYPAVPTARGALIPTFRILGYQAREVTARGGSPEDELLATICHRMNAAFARSAVTLETARSVKHRTALEAGIKNASAPDPELIQLYRSVDDDQKKRIRQLEAEAKDREAEYQELLEEYKEHETTIESLKHSLQMAAESALGRSQAGLSEAVRTSLTRAITDDACLADVLDAIGHLYPDRVVILESARRSAGDAAKFKNPRRAFDLLNKLCGDYWESLANGTGDARARDVFGSAFAAKESETVERNNRARKLRTFEYKGKPMEMWSHLKIGVKDSVAETFRAHFEWDPQEKKIVLGHCGKHLDQR